MTVLNEGRQLRDAAKARLRVREGRPADVAALVTLFAEALEERAANTGITARSSGPLALLARAGALLGRNAPVKAAVADLDGEILAAAWAVRRTPEAFAVEGVATTGEWRGEGLGDRVYRHLFQQLRAAGVRRLYADVEPWNAGALRFHERLGFGRAPGFEDRPVLRRVYRWVREYRGHLGPWTPLNLVRPLEPADAPGLAALFRERYGPVFAEAEGLEERALAGLAGGPARRLRGLTQAPPLALVARDGSGRVLGGAVAARDPGSYRLGGLVVQDGDEGVAMALLHTVLYGLQGRGARRLVANVPAGDGWLAAMLDRAGFESFYRQERVYRYGEVRRSLEFEALRYRREL